MATSCPHASNTYMHMYLRSCHAFAHFQLYDTQVYMSKMAAVYITYSIRTPCAVGNIPPSLVKKSFISCSPGPARLTAATVT